MNLFSKTVVWNKFSQIRKRQRHRACKKNALSRLWIFFALAVLSTNGLGQTLTLSHQDPGETVPRIGISYFDHYFSALQNGQRVWQIPYPLEELQRSIPGRTHGAHYPLGRSLQKPVDLSFNPFVFPRTVFAFQNPFDNQFRPIQRPPEGKIFIGHHGVKGQLEVISYNEIAGRAEFQIVTDYQEGRTPKVSYARGLCLTCHTNAGTLFGLDNWSDSNLNSTTRQLIQTARQRHFRLERPETHLNGVEISPRRAGRGLSKRVRGQISFFGGGIEFLDQQTKVFNEILQGDLLWRKACQTPSCRTKLLKIIFAKKLTSAFFENFSKAPPEAIDVEIMENIRKTFGSALKTEGDRIDNHNPYKTLTSREIERLQADPFDTVLLTKLIQGSSDKFLSHAQNPKSSRPKRIDLSSFKHVFLKIHMSLATHKFTLSDWLLINKALAQTQLDERLSFYFFRHQGQTEIEIVKGNSIEDDKKRLLYGARAAWTLQRQTLTLPAGTKHFQAFGAPLTLPVLETAQAFEVFQHQAGSQRFQCFILNRDHAATLCTTLNLHALFKALEEIDLQADQGISRNHFLYQFWQSLDPAIASQFYLSEKTPPLSREEKRRLEHRSSHKKDPSDTDASPLGTFSDPHLKLFKKLCQECHSAPQSYPEAFIHPLESQTRSHISRLKHEIRERLESANPSTFMPPSQSSQRHHLNRHPELLERLLEFIDAL